MKSTPALMFLLLLFATWLVKGQNEASVWPVGYGKQFNFQSGSFKYSGFNSKSEILATICDKDGNLLLSTCGDTVWNKNNEVLLNGTGLVEENYSILKFSKPVFIPYPRKEGQYFLIYTCARYSAVKTDSIVERKLLYAEIDINANNGKGEVTKKQQLILTDFSNDPTIAGYCNNSYFWLAVDYNIPYIDVNGTEKSVLLFYKIDENGISATPKANTYFKNGQFLNLHFSPNGDKLSLMHLIFSSSPFNERATIADFNFLTGELYNYRSLEYFMFAGLEFSPDSRFVYFLSFNNNTSQIVQYDARYINSILNSRTVVADLNQNSEVSNVFNFKLAPDGKIYFSYTDVDGNTKLARINKPNLKGAYCDLQLNYLKLNTNPIYPEFVTSFLRDKSFDNLNEIDADAGSDKQLCPLSKINIGKKNYNENFYQWFPDEYLDNQFLSEPIFSAPSQGNISKTFTKTLRVTNGNCWLNFDSLKVTVLPKPNKANINGSWSICPYAGEVEYWTKNNSNKIEWFANGGEIVTDNFLDTVKISWWDLNPTAAAKVLVTNDFGCTSDTAVFPVRINTELITQPPQGPEYLCIAEAKSTPYWIYGTHGSVYEWVVEGGKIISGQGTNKVNVKWERGGKNKIYIKENSITTDTVCYGESNPLEVEILNDSLEIELTYVSFDLQNNLEVHYKSDSLNTHIHSLIQQTENISNGVVSEFNPLTSGLSGYYIYRTSPEKTGSEIVNIEVINRCKEVFYSNEQQSVVLKGDISPEEQTILLSWNLNRFWNTDHLKHEIWYLNKNDNEWHLVATVNDETNYNFSYQNISLLHTFRIKEINTDKNLESWSNTIEIKVSEELIIPDVFTPNGDGYNDVWEIWNINSFPFKSLTIYDKSGRTVYYCKNSYIPWDGKINGQVYQGTYLYTITFEGSTRYGQLTVLQ